MLSLFWGFISTMWYVKKTVSTFLVPSNSSFISTMWYVKKFLAILQSLSLSVLYQLCGM
ncbi:hypothetical protein [Clostridioides difficile]